MIFFYGRICIATIHYEKSVQDWYQNEKFDYIKKDINAPNVPQAQPIEHFWHLCKFEYSKRANAPKNLSGFRKVWSNIS